MAQAVRARDGAAASTIPLRYHSLPIFSLDVSAPERHRTLHHQKAGPMWLVRIALKRPYTFVVMAMLIVITGVFSIVRMPTDIFPDIDIPVISVIWNYTGLSPEEMEKRIVTNYERILTTTVNDIEHI